MTLVSTRDRQGVGHSYTEVLLEGLAPDGGLYVPEVYPTFTLDELCALKGAPYVDIAFAVKQKLVGGAIPDDALRTLVGAAYGPGAFDGPGGVITPVTQIEGGILLENLSLGPTASFKDMALRMLAQEMQYQLEREGARLFILGATSGDTGSAAEAAVKGLGRISLCMLSPEEGMSRFQKAQMGALSGGNIFNVSIRGRFDDCQDLVKAVKADAEFAHVGAVNSINWGRISAQCAYYVAGYLQAAREIGDPVDFVVPSGNFGNAFSGYVARRMLVPIRRIIIATNENDVLDRLFQTGVYEARPARVTSSPSMDISKASNYERLFFDISGADAEKTIAYMTEFSRSGRVDMRDYGLSPDLFAERGFVSGASTHADRLETIRHVYEVSRQIIDPHTADAVTVCMRKAGDVPTVCLATALPVKFESTIKEALGFVPERPARFAARSEGAGNGGFTVMNADAGELKTYLRDCIRRQR